MKVKLFLKQLKQVNRAYRLWINYTDQRVEETCSSILFKIRTLSYYFAPSSIRFCCLTSIKFLKIKKILITPIFYIKRFIFNKTSVIKVFIQDVSIYIKYIFFKHWKLSLASLILCLLVLILDNTTIRPNNLLGEFSNYFVNSPDQDRLFDLYLALAGIIGAFLGLYFAAASIIAQTIYTKVIGEINKLMHSIRISNIYVISLIFTLAIVLISLFMLIIRIELGKWNFYIICIFSFVSIISFWELASYIFLFFNPANVIKQYILPEIHKNISIVTDSSLYKYDNNYQNHSYKQTDQFFDTYDVLVELALTQDLLQEKIIIEILGDGINYLTWYLSLKSKIPTDSYWFPQKYKHKKYIETDWTDLASFQRTGTMLMPKIIRNNLWVEQRFLNIINKSLKKLFESAKYETYYTLINQFSTHLKTINTLGKSEEVFFILDNLYSPFSEDVSSTNGYCSYIADAHMAIFIDLILSFKPLSKAEIQKISSKKILTEGFIHQYKNISTSIKRQMEDIFNKLSFESKIEESIQTPDWHIQELLSAGNLELANKFYDELIYRILKSLKFYSSTDFVKNNPDVSIAVLARAYEVHHKLADSLQKTAAIFDEANTFERQKKELGQIKNILFHKIIEIYPYLKLSDGEHPDYAGFIYTAAQDAIKEIILDEKNKNSIIVGDLLKAMYHIAKLQSSYIVAKAEEAALSVRPQVVINHQILYYERKMILLFIGIMDLSGYILLFDDIYDKNLKEKIIPVWEEIIKEKTLDSLFVIITLYFNPPLFMGVDTEMQFNLKRDVGFKMQKLDLLWGSPDPFLPKKDIQPAKKYKSILLKNICYKESSLWAPPEGCLIFIAAYLLDLFDEENKQTLLKNWELHNVYEARKEDDRE